MRSHLFEYGEKDHSLRYVHSVISGRLLFYFLWNILSRQRLFSETFVYAGTLNADGSYTTEGYPLTDVQGRYIGGRAPPRVIHSLTFMAGRRSCTTESYPLTDVQGSYRRSFTTEGYPLADVQAR